MNKKNSVAEATEGQMLEFDMSRFTVQDVIDFSKDRFAYTKRAEVMARCLTKYPADWGNVSEALAIWSNFKDAEMELSNAIKAATLKLDDFKSIKEVIFVDYDYLSIADVEAFYKMQGAEATAHALTKVVVSLPDVTLGPPDEVETYLKMSWVDFNRLQYTFIEYLGDYRKN